MIVTDKTIIKPRPGRAAKQSVNPPQPDLSLNNGQTILQSQVSEYNNKNTVLTISNNPLVDCAEDLLSICVQLPHAKVYDDIQALRKQCIELLKNYENSLKTHAIAEDMIESASYCLCCFIDEVVLNTSWGGNSSWASESLLSSYHNETSGGQYFYTLLDQALNANIDQHQLIELMYLCLTLGFIGKMRIEPKGAQKLEALRDRAYQIVLSYQRETTKELSPGWQEKVVKDTEFSHPFPLWVIGALFSVVLLFIYMAFSYQINNHSSSAYKNLTALVPWQDTSNQIIENISRDDALLLQQLLQTEIDRNLLEVEQLSDRIRIRIIAKVLFSSGSTTPRADFEAILAKIARTLESTQGKILITGHTDNEPIFTTKYPSNWHLSLARATSIGNFLANNASLRGRLWPEGRGESEPRYTNDSEENRSLNRRIEIDLLF